MRNLGAFSPSGSGYRFVYRANQPNYCPGCGHTHWMLGRATAECASCGTALPLAEGAMSGIGVHRGWQRPFGWTRAAA